MTPGEYAANNPQDTDIMLGDMTEAEPDSITDPLIGAEVPMDLQRIQNVDAQPRPVPLMETQAQPVVPSPMDDVRAARNGYGVEPTIRHALAMEHIDARVAAGTPLTPNELSYAQMATLEAEKSRKPRPPMQAQFEQPEEAKRQIKSMGASGEDLARHEGFRSHVYEDTLGNDTIGYGFNIAHVDAKGDLALAEVIDEINARTGSLLTLEGLRSGTEGLNHEQAMIAFNIKHKEATEVGVKVLGPNGYGKLTSTQKDILTNMSYQFGATKLRKFKNFLALARNGSINAAAEIIDSNAFKNQVPYRLMEHFVKWVISSASSGADKNINKRVLVGLRNRAQRLWDANKGKHSKATGASVMNEINKLSDYIDTYKESN